MLLAPTGEQISDSLTAMLSAALSERHWRLAHDLLVAARTAHVSLPHADVDQWTARVFMPPQHADAHEGWQRALFSDEYALSCLDMMCAEATAPAGKSNLLTRPLPPHACSLLHQAVYVLISYIYTTLLYRLCTCSYLCFASSVQTQL